jgi:peptidoglycan/LPS O-acetylase OafA/YrhL
VSNLDLLSSILFVRNYAGFNDVSWYTGHFWSLAIEEHFYLLVPLIFATFSSRLTLRIAIVAVIVCAAVRIIEWQLMPLSKVEFRTESRLDAIMYGAILALLFDNAKWQTWLKVNLRMVHVAGLFIIVGAALLLAPPWMPLRRTMVAVVVPFLLGYTVLNARALPSAALELPWMRYVGRLSYSLYVWQQLFLVPDERPLGMLQSFPFAFTAMGLCAVASYYCIEKPFIKMGHRLADTRNASQSSLSSRRQIPKDSKLDFGRF